MNPILVALAQLAVSIWKLQQTDLPQQIKDDALRLWSDARDAHLPKKADGSDYTEDDLRAIAADAKANFNSVLEDGK